MNGADETPGFHIDGAGKEGEWLVWDVAVDPTCRLFAGHFPNRPILPAIGHLLLVRHILERAVGRGVSITALDRFRITRPILPGAELRVRIELQAPDSSARFTIDDAGERSSEASFRWERESR